MKSGVFRMALMAVLVAAAGGVSAASAELPVTYVDDLDLSGASCGQGKAVKKKLSVDGHPLTMSGKVYTNGFGACPQSAVAFKANGKVESFEAIVGVDDDAAKAGSGKSYGKPTVEFRVWADGRVVWTSGRLRLGEKPREARVPLLGVREIVLETRTGGEWTAADAANGDWAEACFIHKPGGSVEPITDPEATAQLGILTPPEKDEPQFNGADIWGVRPGHPVIFRVPVSGIRPRRRRATTT